MKWMIVFSIVGFCGCSTPDALPFSSFLKWMNDPGNGLVQHRYVNGLELKVKYLPPQVLAWQEINRESSLTARERDSIYRSYEHSLTFLFSIGPDPRKKNPEDIMLRSVSGYEDYSRRVYDLNFFMGEHIVLKAGEKEYRPVLTQMENIYGLGPGRNFLIVFTPQEKADQALSAENLEFRYEDEHFGLGINYFSFNRNKLRRIPALIELGSS